MVRIALLLLIAWPVAAHPLPNLRYDRTVDVRLTAAGVNIRYSLEMSEWSMVLDKDGTPTAEETERIKKAPPSQKLAQRIYMTKKVNLLADRFLASANGLPLKFRAEAAPELHENRDHLEFRFRFVAPWPAELDRTKPVEFHFEDGNFESTNGKILLTLKADSGLQVEDLVDPGDLRGLSPLDLKPGQEEKLRKATANFLLPNAVMPIPTLPSQVDLQPVIATPPASLTEQLYNRGLVALFDSDAGLGILLLAAALFGMAHAFTPGHGKTLVAAYLVGEKGTIRHALMLGLTTTLAHTGSVLGVAVVLWMFYRDGVPQSAQGWLQLSGGVLILVVGLWLLLQRLRGRADHVHLFTEHHHHDHRESFGWGRVILLGLGGGLIPCWDAVMLLFVAIAAGKLNLAVPLLVAFSVGLAAVLVTLGVGVVMAHRAGLAHFGERKWFQLLPILSAGLLVIMGLWLAREGVQMLSLAAKG